MLVVSPPPATIKVGDTSTRMARVGFATSHATEEAVRAVRNASRRITSYIPTLTASASPLLLEITTAFECTGSRILCDDDTLCQRAAAERRFAAEVRFYTMFAQIQPNHLVLDTRACAERRPDDRENHERADRRDEHCRDDRVELHEHLTRVPREQPVIASRIHNFRGE